MNKIKYLGSVLTFLEQYHVEGDNYLVRLVTGNKIGVIQPRQQK